MKFLSLLGTSYEDVEIYGIQVTYWPSIKRLPQTRKIIHQVVQAGESLDTEEDMEWEEIEAKVDAIKLSPSGPVTPQRCVKKKTKWKTKNRITDRPKGYPYV